MRKYSLLLAFFLFLTNSSFSQNDPLIVSGKQKQKEGMHQAAIIDLSGAIKNYEPQIQDFLKKWDEYQKINEFDRAEKGMEAPMIDTLFAIPYYLRGISYSATGKRDEALSDLNIAIKVNPKIAGAYCERGRLLWASGKKAEGCIDLRTARTLRDSSAKGLFEEKFCWDEAVKAKTEAVTMVTLNQFESAFDKIQIALKLFPDSASYLAIRGKCYSGMKKYDLAFLDFDKAITLSPNNFDAYFGRALTFYMKNKYQEAFDDFSKVIKMNESFSDAYLYRAYSCEGMQKNQSALYDYRQVQRLKPHDPLAFYKSGLLKNEMGDRKGACPDFVKAASMGHPEAEDYAKQCK